MTFYADMAATVEEILREFGAPGQVTRTEQGGEYDPETGDYVGLTIPEPTQRLAWAGKTYTIMRVENLAPAGTSVLVTMIVRR
jgi:hypothetical protein